MSDGMGREFTYLSSHATNRYIIPNWGIYCFVRFLVRFDDMLTRLPTVFTPSRVKDSIFCLFSSMIVTALSEEIFNFVVGVTYFLAESGVSVLPSCI